jgi:hypothetical protein
MFRHYGSAMAANSHTTSEYAATNTVPKITAPMSHNTTKTTGTGSPRNLPYASAIASAIEPADTCARGRCRAPEVTVRRGWPLLLLSAVDFRRG